MQNIFQLGRFFKFLTINIESSKLLEPNYNTNVLTHKELTNDCNLQLLRLGYKNRVFNRYRVGQKATATAGGCQSYRTIELHNQCMQQLADFHDKYVKLRTKVETGAGEWKGLEKFAATISWKKAYEDSQNATLQNFF